MTVTALAARHVVGVHLHRRYAADHTQADLALPAHRLQRDGVAGTAPQHVGADADAERDVGRRADIGAAERARARTVRREHRPGDHGRLIDADVDTDPADL